MIDFLIAFASGAVSFLSPCIIPMIVVYLTTITGFSFDTLLRNGHSPIVRNQLMKKTAIFVLSFTLVFTSIGALAGQLSGFLGDIFSVMSSVAGFLFIILGLHYVGLLKKVAWRFGSMMSEEKIESIAKRWRQEDGTLSNAGVFIIGLAFALVCSHCISPTLLPALAIAASTGNITGGAFVMLGFSLGLGLSFMIAGFFFSRTIAKFEWIEKNMRTVQLLVGLIFLIMGVLLISGQYLSLVSLLYKIVPWDIGM